MATRLVPPRWRRLAAPAVVLALALLGAFTVDANPHGWVGASQSGCTCHASAPAPDVDVRISGLPANYTPGRTYTLEVSIEGGPPVQLDQGGHAGGFNLRAEGGSLRAPRGSTSLLRSQPGALLHDMTSHGHGEVPFPPETYGELTFSHEGANQRRWTVQWKAPSAGSGNATLFLAGLAANGDHFNSDDDRWNLRSFDVAEGPATGGNGFAWWVVGAAVVLGAPTTWWVLRRRAAASARPPDSDGGRMVSCPTCGAEVRKVHLEAHERKVHR